MTWVWVFLTIIFPAVTTLGLLAWLAHEDETVGPLCRECGHWWADGHAGLCVACAEDGVTL